MIELVFLACIASSDGECREQSLLFSDVTMMTCMTQAQIPLAEWSATHPDWTIRRWSCQIPDGSVRI